MIIVTTPRRGGKRLAMQRAENEFLREHPKGTIVRCSPSGVIVEKYIGSNTNKGPTLMIDKLTESALTFFNRWRPIDDEAAHNFAEDLITHQKIVMQETSESALKQISRYVDKIGEQIK